jgi:periplasmic protein TonB
MSELSQMISPTEVHEGEPSPNASAQADLHLQRLLAAEPEPFTKSLIRNIREAINPPKIPEIQVTSRPVAVKDIWGLYGRKKQSFLMSTGFQVVVVAIVFTLGASKTVRDAVAKQITPLIAPDIAPYQPKAAPQKQAMGGGGGGGDRSPLPASKGRLPKLAPRQFTPPVAVINNPNPKLVMEPTIVVPPNVALPNVNMPNYGDPLARIGPPSNGPGSGGGIGSGSGGGVGSGKGPGFGPGEGGGVGGGVFRVGGGVSPPTLLYKVEPEYSEEARRAKYQGTVVLYVEVSPDGKAHNLRVVRSLGLGLDEKAMEAVNKWKFKPGLKDGKPVTVAATIEVNFRLL